MKTRKLRDGRGWRILLATMAGLSAWSGVAQADFILEGDFLSLGVNDSDEPGTFLGFTESFGARYDSTGADSLNGPDFWSPGEPVYNYVIGANNSTVTNGQGWFVAPTVLDTSAGTVNSATITGQPFEGLQFSRVLSFNDTDQVFSLQDTLTNLGTSEFSNVVTLDSADPDQGGSTGGSSATANDVVSVVGSNDFVRASSYDGTQIGLTVGFGSPDSLRVVGSEGFDNTEPFEIIDSPVDPDGAIEDEDISLAADYGTLGAGESRSFTWYQAFGADAAAADANYAAAAGKPAPVPEPGTMALMGIGLASLVAARRRKKNAERDAR